MDTFNKQPAEILDYDIEAGDWLTSDDFIVTATSTSDTGITVQSTTVQPDQRSVKVWIAGGTSGTTYKIQVTMTTDAGRVKETEFRIRVKEI